METPRKKQESSAGRIITDNSAVTSAVAASDNTEQKGGNKRKHKAAVGLVSGKGNDGGGDNNNNSKTPPSKRARASLSSSQEDDDDRRRINNNNTREISATASAVAASSASASTCSSSSTNAKANNGVGGGKEEEWRVVLLVDSREPPQFLEKLTALQIDCERRPLATFDYLWVATRRRKKISDDSKQHQDQSDDDNDSDDELVLDHGVERKEIHDLASGLNIANKRTGLTRSVEQHLKMNQSGVRYKHFVVQGKIANLYQYPFRFNATIKKRITKHIKDLEMEDSGYQVHRFVSVDPRRHTSDETVDFLQRLHYQVQERFRQHHQQQQEDYYYKLTYREMAERAAWVTKVASARKVLAKCALGEKKLAAVLKEFLNEQAFRKPYDEAGGQAAMVERLASLQTNGTTTNRLRHAFSRSNAEALCAHLVSVTMPTATTTHTGKAAATGSARTTRPAAASTCDTPTKATAAAAAKSAIVTPERDSAATDNKPTADGTTAKAALFVD